MTPGRLYHITSTENIGYAPPLEYVGLLLDNSQGANSPGMHVHNFLVITATAEKHDWVALKYHDAWGHSYEDGYDFNDGRLLSEEIQQADLTRFLAWPVQGKALLAILRDGMSTQDLYRAHTVVPPFPVPRASV